MLHNSKTDYRVEHPIDTLKKLLAMLKDFDLEAQVKQYDDVYISKITDNDQNLLKQIHPQASCAWGKGYSKEQALVSGYAEFIEKYCFFNKELTINDVFSFKGIEYTDINVFRLITPGIATGNTFFESLLHGLCEWIEQRHIRDYLFRDSSGNKNKIDFYYNYFQCLKLVRVVNNIEVRYFPTPFNDIAHTFIACGICEDTCLTGAGCHPDPEIASNRAVAEVFQTNRKITLYKLFHNESSNLSLFNYFIPDLEEMCMKIIDKILHKCGNDVVILNFNLPEIDMQVHKVNIVNLAKLPINKSQLVCDPNFNCL